MNTTSTLDLPGYDPAETYYYEDGAISEGSEGESSDEPDSAESEGSPPKEDS
jgi:hypothetical protein